MVCGRLPLSPVPVAHPHPTAIACHSPLLLPEASEVVCDSDCIISPWKAQLNPELMMMAEGRDPVPVGTTWREGRRRTEERRRKDAEAAAGCWESPHTGAASWNAVWEVGAAEWGLGTLVL